MLWVFAPLALTGYLIQVFVGRDATHAAGYSGVLFVLGYALHPKRRTQADTGTDE